MHASPQSTQSAAEMLDSKPGVDALQILKEEHDAVLGMFDRYEDSRDDREKQELANEICRALTIHGVLEEEIFYPAIREALPEGDIDDILDEADVEHGCAAKLIDEIRAGVIGDELFDAKIIVLGEYVKHHIDAEYEEIFPAAEESGVDLIAMGHELSQRRIQLMEGDDES